MLAEAGVNAPDQTSPERPAKRRRAGPSRLIKDKGKPSNVPIPSTTRVEDDDEDDDEDIEFQDVVIPEPTVQTMELESDEEDEDDEDIQFENVDFTAPLHNPSTGPKEPKSLELNLTALQASTAEAKKAAERRKPLTREEKKHRVDVHKTHLLCLLSHVARRNHWCNDSKVQDNLLPHLTDKMVTYLNPGTDLSQFGRTESLKNGLKQVEGVWKTKFEVTERGIRRALWAEEPEHLQQVRALYLA